MRGIQSRQINKIEEAQRHYVYLYRDPSGRAMYVGYGKAESRATSHLTITHNQRKAESVLRGVHQISTEGFSNFKRRILAEGPSALVGLPGIGPITKDHLARNIGLASLAKDDIWIRRVRKAFGFADKDAFADLLARRFRLPPGLVDFVIWQYCADHAWKPGGYPSLEAACHGRPDSSHRR